jgi:hypothetical protein
MEGRGHWQGGTGNLIGPGRTRRRHGFSHTRRFAGVLRKRRKWECDESAHTVVAPFDCGYDTETKRPLNGGEGNEWALFGKRTLRVVIITSNGTALQRREIRLGRIVGRRTTWSEFEDSLLCVRAAYLGRLVGSQILNRCFLFANGFEDEGVICRVMLYRTSDTIGKTS